MFSSHKRVQQVNFLTKRTEIIVSALTLVVGCVQGYFTAAMLYSINYFFTYLLTYLENKTENSGWSLGKPVSLQPHHWRKKLD